MQSLWIDVRRGFVMIDENEDLLFGFAIGLLVVLGSLSVWVMFTI